MRNVFLRRATKEDRHMADSPQRLRHPCEARAPIDHQQDALRIPGYDVKSSTIDEARCHRC